jgi:hypothetical protein
MSTCSARSAMVGEHLITDDRIGAELPQNKVGFGDHHVLIEALEHVVDFFAVDAAIKHGDRMGREKPLEFDGEAVWITRRWRTRARAGGLRNPIGYLDGAAAQSGRSPVIGQCPLRTDTEVRKVLAFNICTRRNPRSKCGSESSSCYLAERQSAGRSRRSMLQRALTSPMVLGQHCACTGVST